MANNPTIFQRLRQFLRSDIKGKFINALLEAIAVGDELNESNVLALKENLLIATASERFLEKRAAELGILKPAGVGIDDNAFRNMAISINSNQAVSSIFFEVLEQFYGQDAVSANMTSTAFEPYSLVDGQTLYILIDGSLIPLTITFKSQDFTNISAATATEVASAISRAAVLANSGVTAIPLLDASSGKTYVQLFSKTKGPRSSIAVTGGEAQNSLLFPEARPTSQASGTTFTVSISGGNVRYTWTAGADPSLQNINEGDYAIIKAPPFPQDQKGTFVIQKIVPDVMGSGYFEINNPSFQSPGSYVLASADGIRFYMPKKALLTGLSRYATLYEVNPFELVIIMPATTKIVKRSLIGGWRFHPSGLQDKYQGSYMYDTKNGFSASNVYTTVTQSLSSGQPYSVIPVLSSANFPDKEGYIVLDYGTTKQEGPIRYLGKPSSGTLLLDASYLIKQTHVNPDITLLRTVKPYVPAADGSDLPTYITGTTQGRIVSEQLMSELAAAGIVVSIIITYPAGPGLQDITAIYA